MLLQPPQPLVDCEPEGEADRVTAQRWGATSETGRLTDVLLSGPAYLAMVPCNEVTRKSLANGLSTSSSDAARQHRAFVAALEQAGVRCHFAPPSPGLADMSFTRDAAVASPWGLIELRAAAPHRQDEVQHTAALARRVGLPHFARIASGVIEGGDICLLREGVMVVGVSGDRTDEAGARALGALFEQRGWDVTGERFDPRFLHLDTIFTMVSAECAVAFEDALSGAFVARVRALGIEIVPATADEVCALGANLLSLGNDRIVSPANNRRLNAILERKGFNVIPVEIDQFTRCGGGVHCLTMPLRREEEARPG